MGEFIIAILVVSLLWVLWDVLKLFLGEKYREEQVAENQEPGRARMERYAQAFELLSDTFLHMPSKKEHFSEEDVQEIFGDVQRKVCAQCQHKLRCWEEHYYRTCRMAYDLLHGIEEEGEELNPDNHQTFQKNCGRSALFLHVMTESFRVAKLNLMWSNRLLENRKAVAEQLHETAAIIAAAAETAYDAQPVEMMMEKQMEIKLRMHGIILREIRDVKKPGDRLELFLTMRMAGKGRCMATREVASLVSEVCSRRMVPDRDSRTVLNRDYSTVLFLAEPDYCMLNGVARMAKDGELISGDNFSMFRKEDGQMIMSLSDGMGSGRAACQESETVIELLEQFLHAGFGKETAVRMIHSTLMLQNDSQIFSTVDLCMVDLYTGECELLKIGASTTFFYRKDWVETVSSTSLPIGIVPSLDYESTKKKLEPGEFVIMVSDGVLDALPDQEAEEVLKEIILHQNTKNAQEMAKGILSTVLLYHQCQAVDDMTVLVGGLWKS